MCWIQRFITTTCSIRSWQKLQATASGADDALMLDGRGFVAETNATHVFIVQNDTVITSRTVACPEGITRDIVLKLCEQLGVSLEVRDYSLAEVYRSEEMFCTGTMGELAPVLKVDGNPIGSGEPGPMWAKLRSAFRELTSSTGVVVVE